MTRKDKSKTEGDTRKSKRTISAAKVDGAALSETLNSVGHLFNQIPAADIKWAKSHVKRCQKK